MSGIFIILLGWLFLIVGFEIFVEMVDEFQVVIVVVVLGDMIVLVEGIYFFSVKIVCDIFGIVDVFIIV